MNRTLLRHLSRNQRLIAPVNGVAYGVQLSDWEMLLDRRAHTHSVHNCKV